MLTVWKILFIIIGLGICYWQIHDVIRGKGGDTMNLIRAEAKAKYLINELRPFCDRIEIVGNIRRRKQLVDNIDILLIPKSVALFELTGKIVSLGCEGGMKVDSKKVVVVKDEFEGIKANLWFTSLAKWPVMLFVKTGGSKSIKRIAKLCSGKKWELSINDGAIFDENGKKLLIEKEEDIFKHLGIPTIEPSWRE